MRGNRLKEVREKRGLTQKELSLRVGIGEKQIWRYENGTSDPSSEHVRQIANELRCSSDYLLGLSDIMSLDLSENSLTPDEQLVLDYYRFRKVKQLLQAVADITPEGAEDID